MNGCNHKCAQSDLCPARTGKPFKDGTGCTALFDAEYEPIDEPLTTVEAIFFWAIVLLCIAAAVAIARASLPYLPGV